MARHFAARAVSPAPPPRPPIPPPSHVQLRDCRAPMLRPRSRPSLPSPYAGFWLRLVAYLIDDVLLGIGDRGIRVDRRGDGRHRISIRSMFEGMNGEDPPDAGGDDLRNHFRRPLLGRSWVALQCRNGKFPASRDARKNGAGIDRHRFARTADRFRPRQRKIFRKNYHWTDSVRHWLHHGGIHGERSKRCTT